jgi:hypothetical protein
VAVNIPVSKLKTESKVSLYSLIIDYSSDSILIAAPLKEYRNWYTF